MASGSLVGKTLGKYKIVGLLGAGGMATVYQGLQPGVDRTVAVKVLPPHPGQSADFVERFRLEARTIARLQHPHILPLYDYGDEDGILYLVMPYIDGGSLAARIAQGPMAVNTVIDFARQIGGALDYAHRQGIIHRDLKPENVLLDREGNVLLADFGIVKLVEGTKPAGTLTATGGLIGTPAYMSPEQAQGEPIDSRSDLYSLGMVVFEMLTGQQPYTADTAMQIIMQQISAPVPSLSATSPNASPVLDQVLRKALAKDPAARYRTAAEFVNHLTAAASGQTPLETTGEAGGPTVALTAAGRNTPHPGAAPSEPALTPAPPPRSSTANTLLLLGGFAIIAVLIVVALVLLTGRERSAVSAVPTATQTPAAPTSTARPVLPAEPEFGRAVYSTTASLADTVSLQINDVAPPASGSRYIAWLVNTGSGETRKLGEASVDAFGSGVLTYTDPDGVFLPALYNAVALTAETSDVDAPGDSVVYSGSAPLALTQALADLFVTVSLPATEGHNAYEGSLLSGLQREAGIARTHAGLAAGASNLGGLQTHAEHTINILDGTSVDFNGNGRGENPGSGFGLAYFLDEIEARLDAAAQSDNVGPVMQGQMELIRVCIGNVRQWKDEIVGLEQQLLTAPDLESVAGQRAQSTEFADALIEGTDLNSSGIVEAFEGECGLDQISTYGITVANMILREGEPQG
ncbi:MAG TPA: protein kinase [Candidatus Limnocylindrales bacterium]|nr:protein kinase [Candidatus Limnocylindrales bacterium]